MTPPAAGGPGIDGLESQFEELFGAAAISVGIFDRYGCITEANGSFADMLGVQRDHLIGQDAAALTHPDDRRAGREALERLFAGQTERYRIDKRYMRADGSVIWAVCSAELLDSGEHCLEVVEDISELVRARGLLAEKAAQLRMALESASMWTFDCDLLTGSEIRSDTASVIDGFNLPVCGTIDEVSALVHPDDTHLFGAGGRPETDPNDNFTRVYRLRASDGGFRWVHERGHLQRDDSGAPLRMSGTRMDITGERRSEDRRRRAEAALHRTLHAATDAFVSVDRGGVITEWNAAAERVFGWSSNEACGRAIDELIVPLEEQARFQAVISDPLSTAEAAAVTRGPTETVVRHRDGSLFPAEISWISVNTGEDFRFSAFIRDITERRALLGQLERQAVTDPVTGLPNRALLRDRLAHALRRLERTPGGVGVLLVDVDGFKDFNETLGHDAGDQVLRGVASRLSAVARAEDTLARFDGDAFVVAIENPEGLQELVAFAKRVIQSLDEPVLIQGDLTVTSASVGIALTHDPRCTPGSLLRDSQLALNKAKERGRGSMQVFDPAMRREAADRLASENELREAIEGQGLLVHYHPWMSPDGRIAGVEALARWDHPTRGLLHPGEFIPLAEETGLIMDLGARILAEAALQVAAWRDEGHADLLLSVNLSGAQLVHPGLLGILAGTLESAGLDPGALILEITERAFLENPASAAATVTAINDMGLRIAIDDFGTGYSSLLFLRRVPVKLVKLDRFFVAGLGRNSTDMAIAECIITLAHSVGMEALAEGVETEEQLAFLKELGCDLMQGHYWSAALDAEGMGAILRETQDNQQPEDAGTLATRRRSQGGKHFAPGGDSSRSGRRGRRRSRP